MKTAAQATYEAFKNKKAEPFKGWDKEPDTVKEQWQAAADAAIGHAEQDAKEALADDTRCLSTGEGQSPACAGVAGTVGSCGNAGDSEKKQGGSSVGLVETAEPEKIVTTLGQVAYEAYANKLGWKSGVTGAQLPPWSDDKVLPAIKDGWEESGQAVALAVLNGMTVTQVTGAEAEALLKKQQANVSHDDARAGAGFAVTGFGSLR